jgi:DNA-binding FrmR family transcriptional regulator
MACVASQINAMRSAVKTAMNTIASDQFHHAEDTVYCLRA